MNEKKLYLLNLSHELNNRQKFKGMFHTRLAWVKQGLLPKDDAHYFQGIMLNDVIGEHFFVNSYYYVYYNDTIRMSQDDKNSWIELLNALSVIEQYERLHFVDEFPIYEVMPTEEEYIQAMVKAGDIAAKLQPHGDPKRPINSDFSLWMVVE